MGGNFVSAVSDTEVTEDAMRRADLTVHVSTKLNRSHVVTGREALILPALGRSEKDLTGGREQRVTVEDSMSAVHASKGPLKPASKHLKSEVDIVCSLAEATLGADHDLPWADYRADYTTIRRSIANVVPGCAAYDEKVDQPGGFVLPHPPRDSREFPTKAGLAMFSVSPIDVLDVPEGHLLLQTLRSHDQFNTTIYGLDDRYRGVKGGRRVVFVHPDDITHLGFADGDLVDIVSEWHDGSERAAVDFRIVSYDQPRGCAAAYYPETNPLIPLESKAEGSNTPTSKSVVVRLERPGGRHNGVIRGRVRRAARHGAQTRDGSRSPVMTVEQRRVTPRDVPLGGQRAMTVRRTLPHARAVADRGVVLPRPLRARRRGGVRRHARRAAPAHRAADRELAVHRRDRAPRQRRPPRDGPARRAQPDDRRPRHQPLRGVDARDDVPARRPALARAPGRRARRDAWRSSTTRRRPSVATAGPPGSSSARCSARPRRCPRRPRCSAPSCCSSRARRSSSTSTRRSSTASSSTPVSCTSTGPRSRSTSSRTSRTAADRLSLQAGPGGARVLVLGGEPFGEPIVMWWNFVGRTHEEVVAAREDWQAQLVDGYADGRFGIPVGNDLDAIPAPPLPNVRLRERR